MANLTLAAAIKDVRAQLIQAMAEGEHEALRFHVKHVDIELAMEFQREGEGSVGFKAWVVEVGAGGSVSSAATHKIKLSLEIAGDRLIGDRDEDLRTGDRVGGR